MHFKKQVSQSRQTTIKLWPPSQTTRQMIENRMRDNLSAPTIFTGKYGSLTKHDASEYAKQIEESAFASANEKHEHEPDGDGSSAIQLYARECSKLILEILKRAPGLESKEIVKPKVFSAVSETFFDISKGQRAFIEEDEARTLLGPLREAGNSFTKICLSNRSFGLSAARVAGPILESIKKQLKEVDLSDFVAGRPEAEAFEVMNIFSAALEGSQLKYLNLSDNSLGEKGVRAFGKLLQSQTSLEELYLMNDGISGEAACAVRELVPSTGKLKVLQFHNNMTGDEGAMAIADILCHCPSLEDFRCSSTRVGSVGGVALSKAFEECKNMKKLDLRDNLYGVSAGIKLSQALSKLEYLTEIYLSYLNLEDEAAIAIVSSLKDSSPSLRILEMAGNDITAKAAPSIASCIAAKKALMKLNLSENYLKDNGAIHISMAFGGIDQLIEIDVSLNSLRRAGARMLAQALVHKPGLKLLNVNGNFISDEGLDELKDIFQENPNKLGPLDENEPDGEDYEDQESGDEGEGSENELESKLKNLDVSQQE